MTVKEKVAVAAALKLAQESNKDEVRDFLLSFFEFDNGVCLGYKEKSIKYYNWLAQKPS